MNIDTINIIGFVATFSAFIIFVPQAISTWKYRDDPHALEGVSLGTQVLVLASAVLWILYGWYMNAIWVAVHESLAIPTSLFIMYQVIKSRKALKETEEQDEQESE